MEMVDRFGLIPPATFRFLILLIALTMLTTPLMPVLGERLAKFLNGGDNVPVAGADTVNGETPRVIIAGFGRVGRRVAKILGAATVPAGGRARSRRR